MTTPPPPRRRRRTARDLEAEAAGAPPPHPPQPLPPGEAVAMLIRRGFKPRPMSLDVPFPHNLDEARASRLCERLGHYAFRLFLRGLILAQRPLLPSEATQYLKPAQAEGYATQLVELGLARREKDERLKLLHPAQNFGGTLEWYVARELRVRLGFDVATGLKFHAEGVGGDLDVVATAEGKLLYLELKSSPPKHLASGEVEAFLQRVRRLRPDVALFVMDTSLRLEDKVLPMLREALGAHVPAPRRILREVWALTPHLYLV
ncbi:MAG: hypothetical protein L0Y64_04235, partial [Myxococcaceae bacterium]|nr:hypothetical protein [Myxococcaceae bacterium]